jgi:hypothetical protein
MNMLGIPLVVIIAATVNLAVAVGDADRYAVQLQGLINDYRTQHGLNAMSVREPLPELAQQTTRMARDP